MTDPQRAASNMSDARSGTSLGRGPGNDGNAPTTPPVPSRKMAAPLGVYYPQAKERERERALLAARRADRSPVPLRSRLEQLWHNLPLIHQVLLAIVVVVLFWQTLFIYFLGDDFGWLRRARYDFTQPGAWVNAFVHASYAHTYRPLSQQVFFWVGLQLFGTHALRYHVVQLAAYLLTTLALYHLLLRLTRAPWIAFGATAVWAFSLTHYDALGWTSAITETSAVLFAALSLLTFATKHQRLAVLCYVLGLLCDESVIVLPAMAFAYLLIARRTSLREAIRQSLGYWIAFAIYAILRVTVIGLTATATHTFVLSPAVFLSLLLKSASWALGDTPVLPFMQQYSSLAWRIVASLAFWLSTATLAGLLAACVVRAVRSHTVDDDARDGGRLVLLGVLWFVLGLTPVILFTANLFVQYNLSLGLVGAAVIVAGLLRGIGRHARPLAAWVAVVVALLNGVLLYAPAGQVRDDTIGVLANAAYGANQEMLAAERQHPGPLYIHITGDAASPPHLTYVLYGNDAADLVAPGSIVCYTATCSIPINLTLHFDGATWSFEVVSGS